MDKRHELGRRGEEIASLYLKKQGYRVVARNYRSGRTEIDIICQRNKWLIFTEVKTRRPSVFGPPETSVGTAQAHRIVEAASVFAEEYGGRGWLFRFDIIAITWRGSSWTLSHFMDAFY